MPFPSPEDIPDPRIEHGSPALQADSLPTELRGSPNYKITYNLRVQDLILKEDETIRQTIQFSGLLLNPSKDSGFCPSGLILVLFSILT